MGFGISLVWWGRHLTGPEDWIPASAGMTVGVVLVVRGGFETRPYENGCMRLFSEESFMSVVTGTTNHENGCKGDSRIAPTGKASDSSFMQESLMWAFE